MVALDLTETADVMDPEERADGQECQGRRVIAAVGELPAFSAREVPAVSPDSPESLAREAREENGERVVREDREGVRNSLDALVTVSPIPPPAPSRNSVAISSKFRER